jgi:predicted RND superfamily exporter protein
VQSAPVETVDEVMPNAAQIKPAEQAATKEHAAVDAKIARLVDWNVDVLNRLLGLIVRLAFTYSFSHFVRIRRLLTLSVSSFSRLLDD